jgi:hypothetical protein
LIPCKVHDVEWSEEKCPSCEYELRMWIEDYDKCEDGNDHDYEYKKSYDMMNFYTCARCGKEIPEYDTMGSHALHMCSVS